MADGVGHDAAHGGAADGGGQKPLKPLYILKSAYGCLGWVVPSNPSNSRLLTFANMRKASGFALKLYNRTHVHHIVDVVGVADGGMSVEIEAAQEPHVNGQGERKQEKPVSKRKDVRRVVRKVERKPVVTEEAGGVEVEIDHVEFDGN